MRCATNARSPGRRAQRWAVFTLGGGCIDCTANCCILIKFPTEMKTFQHCATLMAYGLFTRQNNAKGKNDVYSCLWRLRRERLSVPPLFLGSERRDIFRLKGRMPFKHLKYWCYCKTQTCLWYLAFMSYHKLLLYAFILHYIIYSVPVATPLQHDAGSIKVTRLIFRDCV